MVWLSLVYLRIDRRDGQEVQSTQCGIQWSQLHWVSPGLSAKVQGEMLL